MNQSDWDITKKTITEIEKKLENVVAIKKIVIEPYNIVVSLPSTKGKPIAERLDDVQFPVKFQIHCEAHVKVCK